MPDLEQRCAGAQRWLAGIGFGLTAIAVAAIPAVYGGEAPPAPVVPAQDLSALPIQNLLNLEVSSASKFEQTLSEAPSAVSVLTAEDFRDYGWRTLGEALASLPGLYVDYDRSYATLGARGFLRAGAYGNRFLLLIDGNRINDSVYDQAPVGTEFLLDIDNIERIEYVAGPGSAVYGANAFFGVINVITKKGSSLEGAHVQLEGGSDSERQGRLSYGWHGRDGGDVRASINVYDQPSGDLYYPEFDTPAQNHGIADDLDYDRAQRYFFKAAYDGWSLSGGYGRRTKGIPTASFEQLFDTPGEQTRDAQGYLTLAYERWLSARNELTAHAYWGRYDYQGLYYYDEPAALNVDGARGLWYGGDAQWTTTVLPRQKLVFGAEYRRDARRDQFNYDVAPAVSYLQGHHSADRGGFYVEDEIRITPILLLNVGGRYDRDSYSGDHLNPRVALIAHLSAQTTLKAIYGSAYRAPNAFELYYAVPGEGGQRASPDLSAERIHASELMLVQGWDDVGLLTASVYHYEIEDLISQDLDTDSGQLYFQNLGRVTANGAELGYEHRWGSGARLRGSYAWQYARDDSVGAGLQNSPRGLAKLNVSMPLWAQRLRVGMELQYVGAQQGTAGQVGGHWLSNLTLQAPHLPGGFEAAVSLYNVFDSAYADPGGPELTQRAIPQDGFSLRAHLGWHF